ncbi:hypothetical protein [Fusobacterium sp. MFO224]|uniref:hypothetical protein n=1 Tax=Fusobacterium sp. MFO224 TaxID=3378070 RepID=UPI0038540AFE
MKKNIILILSLFICTLAYSQKFWGNDYYNVLSATTEIGIMDNVITGVSRRKLKESEAITITLEQKWDNKIKNIRIESLPSRDHVDFLRIPVGKVYDYKYYVDGREVGVGDVIQFPTNSNVIKIKILATYAGYEYSYPPNNGNNRAYTDWIGRMRLRYDVPYYKEKNRTIDIAYLYYQTDVVPKVEVDVQGKMDFGQVVAGNVAMASVDVDVYYFKDKSTYEIPDSIYIKNSNGNELKVGLDSYVMDYNSWDSHSKITITGDVKTEKNTPTGKYKGSFYVKFRFK